jgi:hypothetical protein
MEQKVRRIDKTQAPDLARARGGGGFPDGAVETNAYDPVFPGGHFTTTVYAGGGGSTGSCRTFLSVCAAEGR